MAYPDNVLSWTDKTDGEDTIFAADINAIANDLVAAETELNTHKADTAKHRQASGTTQSGTLANAEGSGTTASGDYSHAGGQGTIAAGPAQTAIGKYNISDTDSLLIIGKGTADGARANALTVGSTGWLRTAGIKTATITTTWTGTSAPYTQAITVSGITADDTPIICPVYSANNSTAILERKAWNMIGKIETSADTITVTCFEEKPTQAISIQLKGV